MEKITIEVEDYSKVSDGYHTIQELYDHRIALYIALCKFYEAGYGQIWRAKKHHDGGSYDGWFLLGINTKPGKQITYHIPMEYWKDTEFADTYDQSPFEWDGHTSADVLERIKSL
jgi:hypothetical protein